MSIGVEAEPGSKDYFEAFNVGVEGRAFAGLDLPEPEYAINVWPSEPERFRAAVERYFAEAGRVARTLTSIFESALGEAQGFVETLTDHSIDVLRLNNYEPPDEAELGSATAMGAHIDFGIVMVLWADQVPGLQLLDADGVWHDVMPADGALLVTIGDLTARLTNDVWMSTIHKGASSTRRRPAGTLAIDRLLPRRELRRGHRHTPPLRERGRTGWLRAAHSARTPAGQVGRVLSRSAQHGRRA